LGNSKQTIETLSASTSHATGKATCSRNGDGPLVYDGELELITPIDWNDRPSQTTDNS